MWRWLSLKSSLWENSQVGSSAAWGGLKSAGLHACPTYPCPLHESNRQGNGSAIARLSPYLPPATPYLLPTHAVCVQKLLLHGVILQAVCSHPKQSFGLLWHLSSLWETSMQWHAWEGQAALFSPRPVMCVRTLHTHRGTHCKGATSRHSSSMALKDMQAFAGMPAWD